MQPDDTENAAMDLVQAMRDERSGARGSAGGKRQTLTGRVEQGVEGRSVVLLDPNGAPLANLVGQSSLDVPFGGEVRVTGRYLVGLSSAAQQGRPFEVETVDVL